MTFELTILPHARIQDPSTGKFELVTWYPSSDIHCSPCGTLNWVSGISPANVQLVGGYCPQCGGDGAYDPNAPDPEGQPTDQDIWLAEEYSYQ